jgi:O-methyltransferase
MSFRDLTRRLLGKKLSDLAWFSSQRLAYPPDFTPEDVALCRAVGDRTMTSPERLVALADSVRYVSTNGIPGAIVECGVWRGGSMMAAALTLLAAGDGSRELVLFDTFEGMTAPGPRDVSVFPGAPADRAEGSCESTENEVAANLRSTAYPAGRVRFVKGRVEETVPGQAPERIALLRLDTDWYESTRHELIHLYPRLSPGGVLIVDDYGHWSGARQAVDEYFSTLDPRPMLFRIDYTGRACIKPWNRDRART